MLHLVTSDVKIYHIESENRVEIEFLADGSVDNIFPAVDHKRVIMYSLKFKDDPL